MCKQVLVLFPLCWQTRVTKEKKAPSLTETVSHIPSKYLWSCKAVKIQQGEKLGSVRK